MRFDGRTNPLPIGRSAIPPGKLRGPGSGCASKGAADDVRPDSESSRLVEVERGNDPPQKRDLLDDGGPFERSSVSRRC